MASEDRQYFRNLTLREAIRLRPVMYLVNTEASGLGDLILGVIESMIEEVPPKRQESIVTTIHADGRYSLHTNHECVFTDLSQIEPILIGAKVAESWYPWGRDFNYAVMNNLSELLKIQIERDGNIYEQEFQKGISVSPLITIGRSDQISHSITFKPDTSIFTTTEIDCVQFIKNLNEYAFLNHNLKFILIDERKQPIIEKEIYHPDGLSTTVQSLNEFYQTTHHEIIRFCNSDNDDELAIEFAFQYVYNLGTHLLSYVNQWDVARGGTHITGLLQGITDAINQFTEFIDEDDRPLTVEHIKSGLTAGIVVKMRRPEFSGSMRNRLRLISPIEQHVANFVVQKLTQYFQENQDVARSICNRVRDNIPFDYNDE